MAELGLSTSHDSYDLLPHGGDKLGVHNRLQQLSIDGQLCYLQSSLVSDEQIQTIIIKKGSV